MVQIIEKSARKEAEPHLEKFERFEKQAAQPAWVFPLRKAGMARFAELGFPTLQDEDWRFTGKSERSGKSERVTSQLSTFSE